MGRRFATTEFARQRDYDAKVMSPLAKDLNRQSRDEAGFNKGTFGIDWQAELVTPPAGKRGVRRLNKTPQTQ
jgi:hypothetical protein